MRFRPNILDGPQEIVDVIADPGTGPKRGSELILHSAVADLRTSLATWFGMHFASLDSLHAKTAQW